MCALGNCAVAWVRASRDSAEPSTGTKMRADIRYGSLRNYKIALSMRASIRPLDHEDRDIDRSKHGGGNTAEKLPLEIRPVVRLHGDDIDIEILRTHERTDFGRYVMGGVSAKLV